MTVAFLVVNGDLKYIKREINAISIKIERYNIQYLHFKLNTLFLNFVCLVYAYMCIINICISNISILKKHLRNQYK